MPRPAIHRLALLVAAPLAAMPLVGCTTAAAPVQQVGSLPEGECDAASAQQHLGKKATAAIAEQLLRETGARTLRWVAPDMAVTMDFRPDRLTVSYDRDMAINGIACG